MMSVICALILDILPGRRSWDQYSLICDPRATSAYPVDQLRAEQARLRRHYFCAGDGAYSECVVLSVNCVLPESRLIDLNILNYFHKGLLAAGPRVTCASP